METVNTNFYTVIFGLTSPEIEPESTISVADALFTSPLTGCEHFNANDILS